MFIDYSKTAGQKNELVQAQVIAQTTGKHRRTTFSYKADATIEKYTKNYLKAVWPGYLAKGTIHSEFISYVNMRTRKLEDATGFKITMKDFSIAESFTFWWKTSWGFDFAIIFLVFSCCSSFCAFLRKSLKHDSEGGDKDHFTKF